MVEVNWDLTIFFTLLFLGLWMVAEALWQTRR